MLGKKKMFEWENKFSMETLFDGEGLYEFDEVDEVIKVNNQYFGKLSYGKYEVNIKLTKKEDKITKMTCNCKSRRRNCEHLAAALVYIENEHVPEKTFKHNSLTKYKNLSDVQFEKYIEEDIENKNPNDLKEFVANLLMDYNHLYKNYIASFKEELNDKDIDIILRLLNSILKFDIGITNDNDKFYDKINEFLTEDMPKYDNYPELSYKIYMKIYEKIMSTEFLIDANYYKLLLEDINTKIMNNLEKDGLKYKSYVKSELNEIIKKYPNSLFNNQSLDLLGKLTDSEDMKTNIHLLIKQIDNSEGDEKEEYLTQLMDLLKNNNYSDEEIIKIMGKYNDNFIVIKFLIPYYIKLEYEQIGICSLESFISNVNIYDENRYSALVELKNLQCRVNNINNYFFLILKLILEYNYYNEDDFDKLKKKCPDWEKTKNDLIETYAYLNSNHLYDFYIYNNMDEEFLDEIFNNPDFSVITEYKDLLIKKSPKRLKQA